MQSEDLTTKQFETIPYLYLTRVRIGRLHKLLIFHTKNLKVKSITPLPNTSDGMITVWISDHPRGN